MKKLAGGILVLVGSFGVMGVAAWAQEAAHQKAVKKVDQHWHIVPTSPVDLQNQLEILNKVGIAVSPNQIVVVGDKFVIVVSDPDDGNDEETP